MPRRGLAATRSWRSRPPCSQAAPGRAALRGFRAGAIVTVAGSALAFLLAYLTLPMAIGLWWYVYPRELTAAVYVALALLADLPKNPGLRAVGAAALVFAAVPLALVTADHYRAFDRETRDVTTVIARIPHAPKLLYLVFDRGGAGATQPPFIHLPAYVQAEKGTWLSFHFATWGASFFEWFLVRSRASPRYLFAADPSIDFVAHDRSWWLYHRGGRLNPPRAPDPTSRPCGRVASARPVRRSPPASATPCRRARRRTRARSLCAGRSRRSAARRADRA